MSTMMIKSAVKSENVSYADFRYALDDQCIGDWDSINSEDIIKGYINNMMKDDIHVGHMLRALEEEYSLTGDWKIWLGCSMETPEPINTKKELVDALGLDKEELRIKITI